MIIFTFKTTKWENGLNEKRKWLFALTRKLKKKKKTKKKI